MKKNAPPRWANTFLEWYCNPQLLEQIQGDLHELFYRRADQDLMSARLHFIWNVIRFFRLKNIKKRSGNRRHSLFSPAMFKSYFISGMRNIFRNVVPSSINLVGLSLALGCGITIFLTLDAYYNRDSFHEKGDRLYLLMNKMKSADEVENWARNPYLLAPSIRDEHDAIETVVRIQDDVVSVRQGDVTFSEPVWFVDPQFFDVFSYPILHGRTTALFNNGSMVISEELAIKYFGHTDVVNEAMSVKFRSGEKITYTVGAVLKHISDRSSMSINMLIPMQNWEDHVDPAPSVQWRTWASSTFVLFREGHVPDEVSGLVKKFARIQNQANDKFQVQEVEWIPIAKVAERSYDIKKSLSWSNPPASSIILGSIGVLLVLLACFNYMNVAVASVSSRLKEIGIRKVIGSGRRDIIQQFFVENLLLCTFSLITGTLLAYLLFLPGFNSLYPIHIPFEFSSRGTMFGFFGGVLFVVVFVSGGYPSFYVSSFNPVRILQRKAKFGSKSVLSKTLLTIQFTIAFTTIVACLVFINSSAYFEKKDWGYDHDQRIFVSLKNSSQYKALTDRLAQNKHVKSYAGAESHIGRTEHITTINFHETQVGVVRMEVGFGYLETMNVRLKQGRFFDKNIASDQKESVIINESFVRKMGWKSPLNQSFAFDDITWYVVGVVEDFHFKEFYSQVDPTMIYIGGEERYRYLVVNAEAGEVNSISAFIKKNWATVAPDDPYEASFQDEVFQQFFNSNRSNDKVMYFLSAIALLLACMGLYGLVSYNLTRRLKEFSVRKIFGATLFEIFRLMNKDYGWIILAAFVVGAPLGFYVMDILIKTAYPETIPIEIWPFLFTIVLIAITVIITVGSQVRRIAKESPTVTLRSE